MISDVFFLALGFKVLIKELQSLGLDIRLYSPDNKELELKENIEDAIDFNADKMKNFDGENILDESELDESYIPTDDEDDSDSIFEDLDDGNEDIFDNDLADENILNDEDILDDEDDK